MKHRYLWVFKPLTHLSDEKNNLLITSSCLLGHWPRAGAFGKNPRPSANGIWGWDLTYKEGKETVDNIDFTKRVANGPTDRGFDYFYGLTSPSRTSAPHMVNDMAEKQPNTRFEESGGGLYKIKGGIGHSDWSADGMQPHLADKMLEYLDENKGFRQAVLPLHGVTAPHIPLFPSKEFKGKT